MIYVCMYVSMYIRMYACDSAFFRFTYVYDLILSVYDLILTYVYDFNLTYIRNINRTYVLLSYTHSISILYVYFYLTYININPTCVFLSHKHVSPHLKTTHPDTREFEITLQPFKTS
jgi:hypothetical protein